MRIIATWICWLAVVLALWAVAFTCAAQDAQTVAERLELQRYHFPQEKVHVLTDRGRYLAGDTIWLRAWVVDAATHQPVNVSRFLYVDLVAPNDSVITRVKLHSSDDGVLKGYVPIDINIPEGLYQLTAYTMFMQSAGADYFHRQPVEVLALSSLDQRITSRCVRHGSEVDVTLRFEDAATGVLVPFHLFAYETSNHRWKERTWGRDKEVRFTLKGQDATMNSMLVQFDNYSKYITLPHAETADVRFYPEGGYLVPGVANVMTFQVNEAALKHLSAGELVDDHGRTVAPLVVTHDGVGRVEFSPEPGVTYSARWKDESDGDVTFAIPAPRHDATVAQVRHHASGRVTVQATGSRAQHAMIVVQQRGTLLATGYGKLTLNEVELPPGVVQVLLFDADWHCLSERLFYCRGRAGEEPAVDVSALACASRERVDVSVALDTTLRGSSLAVSVIDNKATVACAGNVLADLLLQSDLRGRILHPEYYFEACDSTERVKRDEQLDLLMLTQGWRRYDIPRVLRGHVAQPRFPIEQSQVVTGRVLSEWRKKPVAGGEVSMIAPRIGYSQKVLSDSLGEFAITLPLSPDSVECLVIAENVKGKKQVNLEVDADQFPQQYYALESEPVSLEAINEQSWRLEHSGDWRHIMLSEVVVTAPRSRLSFHERDAFSLDNRDLRNKGIRTIEGLSYVLPGLVVYNGNIYTPGCQARDLVTIVVDGEPVTQNVTDDHDILQEIVANSSPFEREAMKLALDANDYRFSPTYETSQVSVAQSMVSFRDVDYVHFSRGHQGHGGVLIVQHNQDYHGGGRGEPSRYIKIAHPMGAQQPAEFYSPPYGGGTDCGNAPGTDLRSTLYWNPVVTVTQDGHAAFDFYANDAPNTTYTIVIEGVAPNGTPLRTTRQVAKSE